MKVESAEINKRWENKSGVFEYPILEMGCLGDIFPKTELKTSRDVIEIFAVQK